MPSTETAREFLLIGRNLAAADSLRYVLEHEGYVVAGISKCAIGTLDRVKENPPAVLVIGSELDNMTALEIIRIMNRQHPAVRRIVFVREAEAEYAKAALDEGVEGLLSPDCLVKDILECAATVCGGGHYVYGPHRRNIMSKLGPCAMLSNREWQIFGLVGQGATSQQIADDLFISINTVIRHRANMADKLGLTGPNALALYAAQHRRS